MTRKNVIRILLQTMGTFIALFLVITRIDFSPLKNSLQNTDIFLVCISILLHILVLILHALRWKVLLPPSNITLHKYVYFVFVGAFFGLFLPSAMASEFVKVYTFTRKYGETIRNVGVAVVTRVFGILVQITIGIIGLFMVFNLNEIPKLLDPLQINWSIPTILILIAALTFILRKFLNKFFMKFWDHSIKELITDSQKMLLLLILTIVIQGIGIFVTYLLFLAVNAPISIWQAILFPAITNTVLLIPISFGGVGVREYLNILLFTEIGGVMAEKTLAANMLGYFPIVLAALLGGIWILFRVWIAPIFQKKVNVD